MQNPIDEDAAHLLDQMRSSRDEADRYRERLLDEAVQLRLAADCKLALARHMTEEINEDVANAHGRG